MERALSQPSITIAAYGAVSAMGEGIAPLLEGVRGNGIGLKDCQRLRGQAYQSSIAALLPEGLEETLRSAITDKTSYPYEMACASMAEAAASLGAAFETVPSRRRAMVLSTTKANIEALEATVSKSSSSQGASRHIHPALLAADLASALSLEGPVRCVSAACISGLLALGQGANLIRRGEADITFVVGVDAVTHFVLQGFSTLKALDPEGCRPFDHRRAGLTLGEGAGTIVLARSDLMPGRPRLVGWSSSNDANHLTGPSRDGAGLVLAMERALESAKLTARQVDYVHLHGTGTSFNDAMESQAMMSLFGAEAPPCGSSKGMLGHTLGAAGILESIVCCLALENGILPGSPRLSTPDPNAPQSLLREPRFGAKLRRILKVNSGFGGTNGAIILEGGR